MIPNFFSRFRDYLASGPFRQMLDHFWANLTLFPSKIDRNMSAKARRVVKSVNNQEKWPKKESRPSRLKITKIEIHTNTVFLAVFSRYQHLDKVPVQTTQKDQPISAQKKYSGIGWSFSSHCQSLPRCRCRGKTASNYFKLCMAIFENLVLVLQFSPEVLLKSNIKINTKPLTVYKANYKRLVFALYSTNNDFV
jgi:hypothetical protein